MPSLPTGTVTFLFTDIEGSTKLWEAHSNAMRQANARHDALLRQVIEANNGVVFKTIGDAFCAAFATAPDALTAALAAQLAIAAEAWPQTLTLRVRIALHTGTAELRDQDYFGQPLNRVARLLSAAHGGQTLLSDVAHDLTRDALPVSVSLLPLGEHRLRDLGRPEPVFQLIHPDLPAAFPRLNSLDHLPNNLPQQMTSFIGRDKEMAEIKALLGKTRLLTLTGSGGCGKTRLSLQAAADVLDNYPDGTWFVELAPLADPALVPQTLAQVLNVIEEAGKPLVQTLTIALKNKRLLLVLDNCEHLLDACARLLDTLLRACSGVQILASSREGLGIAGEQTYRLPSLSLPDTKQVQTTESVTQYEAARLFVERALAVQPQFAVTNANAPALASVCQRLDGIPLALELAAARVRSLSLDEINSKLDNRFRLLTGGSRTALPRQQTLRALIDWSYDLLTPQEKTLLRRLSVFAGGWTLDAAEQVGAGASESGESIEEWEALDLLTSLADKSLVLVQTTAETTRYRLLETVRQYARDRLLESGESLAVRARHGDCFLALAEEVRPKLTGPEQGQWLDVLEEEHDNLRQALTLYAEDVENAEAGRQGLFLGAALHRLWSLRGYMSEGRERLSALLAHPGGQEPTKARADALLSASALAYLQSDYEEAHILAEESLTIWRALGDRNGVGASLNTLGNIAFEQSCYDRAKALHEESLAIKRELGNKNGVATSLNNLGAVAFEQEEYGRARMLQQESLAIRRDLGNKEGIGDSLSDLGIVAYEEGDYERSRILLEESLVTRRALGDKQGIAHSLQNLGLVAYEQGEYAQAREMQREGLRMRRDMGNKKSIAYGLEAFAALAVHEAHYARGLQLWAAAAALRDSLSSPLRPSDHEKQKRKAAIVKEALGDEAFASAWAEGRALTMEQAIEYALQANA